MQTTDMRLARMPAGFFHALRHTLLASSDPTDAAALLRRVGAEIASEIQREVENRAHANATAVQDLGPEEFWASFSGLFDEMGWGELRYERLHPGVAALYAANWVEAQPGAGSGPTCHLTTGLIGDLLGKVASAEVAVLEVECRSSGAEECVFLLGAPVALERVFERMRNGTGWRDALAELS